MHVILIGAGLMGTQIGCEYALAGHSVTFVARRLDVARDRLEQTLRLVESSGLAVQHQIDQAGDRISIVAGASAVTGDVDLVVESIVESFDAKVEVLRAAAQQWPGATIATNTSSLSVSALGAAISAPERIIGTHYWNPPLLMPLVEVIPGERASSSVVSSVVDTLRRMGKRPVRVDRDVPGFVWNRLQLALLREAAWIVENGVATPEVVDEIVRDGLARRWRLTGPFETVALGGPETFTRVAANLFPVLSTGKELQDVGRWLPNSEDARDAIKARRDQGLLDELLRDRERRDLRDPAG